jgi:hypothetical protein
MQFEPDWVAVATNVPVAVLTQLPAPSAFALEIGRIVVVTSAVVTRINNPLNNFLTRQFYSTMLIAASNPYLPTHNSQDSLFN